MKYPDYLVHFNPNHDPKTGQFAPLKNKYQYVDGYLTSEGKQRWARQYMSDVEQARKKNQDTSNIQTPIESEKMVKER